LIINIQHPVDHSDIFFIVFRIDDENLENQNYLDINLVAQVVFLVFQRPQFSEIVHQMVYNFLAGLQTLRVYFDQSIQDLYFVKIDGYFSLVLTDVLTIGHWKLVR